MTEGKRFCESCGAEIGQTTNFCPNCGAGQSPDPDIPSGPAPQGFEPGRISTPRDPSVPPPPLQAGGRSWGKILAGGCGVLVLLFLLMVGCAALFGSGGGGGGGGSDDSKGNEKKKAGSSTKQKEEADAVLIGAVATAGDVQWVVTDAQRVNELVREGPTPKLTKTEQGSFVTVDFDFTNNGSDSVTLDNASTTLLDSEGRESRPKTDASTYIPEDRKLLLENVNPGLTRQGRVIFDVPPDASGFQLQVGDTNPFGGEDALVELDF